MRFKNYKAVCREGERIPMIYVDPEGRFTDFATGRHSQKINGPEEKINMRLVEVNEAAAELFMANASYAAAYMTERGLTEEDQKRFCLGGSKDIITDLKNKGFTEDEIISAGLAKRKEDGKLGLIFFKRLMFPIRNPDGYIVGFGGRILEDGKTCKYLNTPETELFRKREVLYMYHEAKKAVCKSFILCEGYMDVIAMHKAGFTNTVASLGTALTKGQVELLKVKPRIYLMFDSDDAGVRAAKRQLPILLSEGLGVKVVNLSPYKDPDELLKAEGREEMVKRIKYATPGLEFLKENYRKGDDPEIFKILLA